MKSDAAEELPQFIELILGPASLKYKVGEIIWYQNIEWRVENVNEQRIVLKRKNS